MAEITLEVCKVTPSQGSHTDVCLPLTFFDLLWLKIPTPEFLFFYEEHHPETFFYSNILPKLKQSLSITLQHFLPLAGNLTWTSSSPKPVVRYVDGDGILFTVAVSDADFDYVSGKKIRECTIFRPLVACLAGSDSQVPTFAIKVTLFPKKGFCICITVHHSVFDGKSVAFFMKSWASIAKFGEIEKDLGNQLSLIFDREPLREKYAKIENSYIEFLKQNGAAQNSLEIKKTEPPAADKVRGTFAISGLEVRKLKELVCDQVPYVTTFTATYAYIILCMVKAKVRENTRACFGFGVDLRGRLEPPLPENYFGNCIGTVAGALESEELFGGDGIAVIVKIISKIKKSLDDEEMIIKGVEKWAPIAYEGRKNEGVSEKIEVYVSGSSRFGYQLIDFGWGKPRKADMTQVDTMPVITFAETGDGGLEAELSLTKDYMESFSNVFGQGIDKVVTERLGSG